MNIKSFEFNPFLENTYVISSKSGNAFVVDPGCYEEFEKRELFAFIEAEKLTVKAVINTHCHIDHVLGNEAVKRKFDCPLKIPKNELAVFDSVVAYAPQWGITGYQPGKVDGFLEEGEILELDEIRLELVEVSGHSPGHLIFYNREEKVVIGGDVLFRESIGRTDLPGGNHENLINNIQNKVYTLPDEVVVYPGHGPETTIGHEKQYNPFVKGI